jgi:geranylgeranyl pyrophosphate synthase
MLNQADIEHELENSLTRYTCVEGAKIPSNLIENIRYSLHSSQRRIRARLFLACAEMTGIPEDVAVFPAIALEMVHCSTQLRKNHAALANASADLVALTSEALSSIAFEVFTDCAAHVKPEFFLAALRRFASGIGPRGVLGGEAEEISLNEDSSLDELRQMHTKKTAALFSIAVLIPKDLAGITEDSPDGLALDIFGRELGLAFQVVHDLEQKATNATPANIRFFLQDQEARNMTLQRLSTAQLSVESAWGEKAKSLLTVANEIQSKLESMVTE